MIECSSKSFLIFEDSTCRFLINMFLIKKKRVDIIVYYEILKAFFSL